MSNSRTSRTRRLRTWTANIALPVISLCLMALIGEGICRLLGYGSAIQFDYVPVLGWVHEPNQSAQTVGGWPVHINSAGLRGREYAPAKPDGTVRILLVGDSVTFGYGVADDVTLAVQLEQLLARECGRVEVINGGVNGYNTEQEVEFVRRIGLRYQPDLVVVGFNPNDIITAEESRTFLDTPFLKELMLRSALYQFLAPRVRAVLFRRAGRAQSTALDQLFAGDPTIAPRLERVREALVDLHTLGVQRSFQPIVAVFPFEAQVYGPAPEHWPPPMFQELERMYRMPVVDLLPALKAAAADKNAVLFLDEPTRHPNPRGLAVAAAELKRFFERSGALPGCKSPGTAATATGP